MNFRRRSKISFSPEKIRSALLRWFARNRTPLPWRRTRDPYRIWVSEVMLQQTRIPVVIPYYKRFLKAFPTMRKLARARRENVLKHWAGLGYYRRAENLHRAARVVAEQYGGKFPSAYDEARRLPGVGDYTARAVLSIVYKKPLAVMDGNVARVLARLFRLKAGGAGGAVRKTATGYLEQLLSRREPGNFNQAMMELGQTVCLPQTPECPLCPLWRFCAAGREGDAARYRASRRRPGIRKVFLATLVLWAGQDILLVRGLPEELVRNLWNFPAAFGPTAAKARAELLRWAKDSLARPVRFTGPVVRLEHHITFRRIQVLIFMADGNPRFRVPGSRWIKLDRVSCAAVSSLARKIAEAIDAWKAEVRVPHPFRLAARSFPWEA